MAMMGAGTRLIGVAAAALALVAADAAPAAEAAKKKPSRVFLKSGTLSMSRPDEKPRASVSCGGGKRIIPLGGGMYSTPSPGADGEGVYPHSFERLGAQSGWHVTPVFYDPSPRTSASRQVVLQVICGPKTRSIAPFRRTVYVQPFAEAAATATCPGGQRLFGGGFQRTNFITEGGNYVTSSRAVSDRAWRVSGSAFGTFGGELTAIAYCRVSKKPLVTEVSSSTTVPADAYGATSTPPCPGRRVLVSGGFSTSQPKSSLFADGYVNGERGWTAGIFNAFGPQTQLTAYGYCHSPNFPRARKGESGKHRNVVAPPILQRAEKAAIAERVKNDGCYPAPGRLADLIRARAGVNTATATQQSGVRKPGVAYVLTHGASCDLVRLSTRVGRRVYTINSATGTVKVKKIG
jgi:hypothetical protein